MIRHIVELGDTMVREIMSPRIDMECIQEDSSIEDVVKFIKEIGHSRVPVYKDRIDNITGILYAKDLLTSLNDKTNFSLKSILRKAYFVPEAKLVADLLAEFRVMKIHMAIVVDEYGGVAGLVTMEDILEEIVGEIQDEYDEEEAPIVRMSEGVYHISARISIDEVNEQLNLELPDEDYDTIGGLVFHQLGRVPRAKEKFELQDQDILFIVEKVNGHRIEKVKLIIKSSETQKGESSD